MDPFQNPSVCNFPPFEECFLEVPQAQSDVQLFPPTLEDVEVAALLYPVHFPSTEASLDTSGISADAAPLMSSPSRSTLSSRSLGTGTDISSMGCPQNSGKEKLEIKEESAAVDSWWQGKGPLALNTPPGKSGDSMGSYGQTRRIIGAKTKGCGEIEAGESEEVLPEGGQPCGLHSIKDSSSSSSSLNKLKGVKEEKEEEGEEEEEEEETLAERLGSLWLAPNPPSPASNISRRETVVDFFTPGTPFVDGVQVESPVFHLQSPASPSSNGEKGFIGGHLGRRRLSFTSSPVKSPARQPPVAIPSPLPKELRRKATLGGGPLDGIASGVNVGGSPGDGGGPCLSQLSNPSPL